MTLFKRKWVWIIVAVLVFAGIGGIIGNDDDKTEPNGTDLSASSSISGSLITEPSESPATASAESASPEPAITVQEQSDEPTASQAVAEPVSTSGTMTVSFIDVGQADSIFIELPNNQTMLIDAGNNSDGEDIVRYIEKQGYDKIDYLVGTHPHEDHIGGMDTIINDLEIGSIYMPKISTNTQTFEDVLTAIQNKDLQVNTAKAGVMVLSTSGLSITMLAPSGKSYDDLNNYSAVVKVVYGDSSFLFEGDAEDVSESQMVSAGSNLRADVLKIGHHGSSSSSTQSFLKAVSPVYAIISCELNNQYGHPHQETLDKLVDIKAQIFRTDLNGTIVVSTSGDGKYSIKTDRTDTTAPTQSAVPSAQASEAPSPAPQGTTSSVIIAGVDKKGELVTIKNTGDTDVDMTGWTLVSVKGNQRFNFPVYVLKAGGSVTVASGSADGDLKWTTKNQWNNSEPDPAQLLDANGNLVSSYDS